MKNMISSRSKGFTLVELIVVIAIIAILAAVTVPAFTGYIDRARLSNDQQAASNMSRALDSYSILNNMEGLEAHDVREIIEEVSGESFNWVPQSRDAGFFYVPEFQKVIVAKYFEVENLDVTQLAGSRNLLLNGFDNKLSTTPGIPGETPEELFGAGLHLMTYEGSKIAEAVFAIRNFADLPVSWEALEDYLQPGFFAGLRGGNKQRAVLQKALDEFNPAHTLYVNNSNWKTTASPGGEISRVVFSPNISNIPAYNELSVSINLSTLTLPLTIRTIETNAFTNFNGVSLVYSGTVPIKVAQGALSGLNFSGVAPTTFTTSSLTNYSGIINLPEDGKNIDFSALPIRDQVTGYRFVRNSNGVLEVFIYTANGLAGYASNMYTVTYFLNFPDGSFPNREYFVSRLISNRFVTPQESPVKIGYTFTGWYTSPNATAGSRITGGTLLPSHVLSVYAGWEINIYTVIFEDYDEAVLSTQTIEHGQSAIAPSNPVRPGHTFTGWSVAFDNVTSNLTVTAEYVED